MVLWEIFVIAGLGFIILEMLVPSMFFLNLAFAGFLTAIISLVVWDWIILTVVFVLLSLLSIMVLRPILLKHRTSKELETGMEAKYIGKIVRVIEPIDKYHGAITIYDERWEARTNSDEQIPIGTEVKIVKYESLILTVERI
jgi:membrane protein implicated in regulation of membrane protease activity